MSSDPICLFLDTVAFGQETRLRLSDFSFAIRRGSFTVFFGETGSGKTLIMKLLAGILHPDEGRVLFDGSDWVLMDDTAIRQARKRMGFVFQDAALLSNLSIRENLALPLNLQFPGWSAAEKMEQIKGLLTRFGIIQSIDRRPSDLSPSQRRLAGWARALIVDPEVVLIDEPLVGLDPVNRKRLMMELASMKASGLTVVCAAQSLIGLDELADMVAVLDRGRLVEFGSVHDIRMSQNSFIGRLVADDHHTTQISRT